MITALVSRSAAKCVASAALLTFGLVVSSAPAGAQNSDATPRAQSRHIRAARELAAGQTSTLDQTAAPQENPTAVAPRVHLAHPAGVTNGTTTTLSVSGSSLAAGSLLTLTANVSNSSQPGQVVFCDLGTGTSCTFLHILSRKQLISGQASYKFYPAAGTHTYQAVFLGTPGASNPFAASTSPTATVSVTGTNSSTALTSSGSPGSYTLKATVTGQRPSIPTGKVTFTNTTTNTVLTSTALSGGSTLTNVVTPQTALSTGSNPPNVVLADFNNDGRLDMAVINQNSNSVSIFFGNGSGGFTLASTVTLSSYASPAGLAVGDFNNDGALDLVTTVYATSATTSTAYQVLVNNGSGIFSPSAPVALGTNSIDIEVADFNRDGNADLAVTDQSSNVVYVLAGSGKGTFTLVSSNPVGSTPYMSAIADFNGDGIPDLAVSSENSNSISILIGSGNGTFTTGTAVTGVTSPTGIAISDYNGDGFADLAVVSNTTDNITIFLGQGTGSFTSSSVATAGSVGYGIAAADFTGDGIADLVTGSLNATVTVLKNNGAGIFTTLANPATGNSTYSVAVGDLNGDGIADIVDTNFGSSTAQAFLVTGTASATAQVTGVSVSNSGANSITASYAGDTHYAPSTSSAVTLQGSGDSTSTVVSGATPNPSSFGQQVYLSATVQDTTSTGTYPQGTVTFTDTVGSHTSTLSGIAVNNGVASTGYTPDTAGAHTVTATFVPSTGFLASSDTTGKSLTVNKGNLTPTGGNYFTVKQGGSTIISIIVDYPAAVTPTGAITVLVNGSAFGLGTPTCVAKFTGTGPHRNCSFPYTNTLAPGQYPITFSQAGDSNYNPSHTMIDTLYVTN